VIEFGEFVDFHNIVTLLHLQGGDVATLLHPLGQGVVVATVLSHNVMLGGGGATHLLILLGAAVLHSNAHLLEVMLSHSSTC